VLKKRINSSRPLLESHFLSFTTYEI
jgi:hypothetical protein